MKNKITKVIMLPLIIVVSVCMTGCWDYQELQQRGYVLGIAIDKPEAVSQKLEGGGSKYSKTLKRIQSSEGTDPKYAYTLQVPIISKSQVKPVGQGGGGEVGKRTWDLTAVGNSFFEASRIFATRLDYPAFYEHMQVLVINEDVARSSMSMPLDVMIRDSEMRRKMKVFITPQPAYTVLDVVPKIDDYASVYLKNLTNNFKKTSRIAYQIDIGHISENIRNNMDYILPRVIASKEEIKVEGSSIIKQDKFVGSIGEIDTSNVEWIKGIAKGGTIVISMPGNSDELLTLELKRMNSKVRPIINGKSISIKIEVKAEVDIGEQFRTNIKDNFKEAFVDEVERSASRKIEHGLTRTIKYVQDEFGADIFLFDVAMLRYAPDTWDEVKDTWSEHFSELDVKVSAVIDVRKRGLVE